MFDSRLKCYANPKRRAFLSKRSKSNSIRNIRIDSNIINPKFTFSQEIPEQLKYKNFWEKLKFWNKTSRDRWSYDKIPKDAKELDQNLPYNKYTDQEVRPMMPTAVKAANKLQKDSTAYKVKTQNYLQEHNDNFNAYDTYYDIEQWNDIHVILLQRYLVARKMLNKLKYHIVGGKFYPNGQHDYTSHNKVDHGSKNESSQSSVNEPKEISNSDSDPQSSSSQSYFGGIPEGAKDVELIPGTGVNIDSQQRPSLYDDLNLKYVDFSNRKLFKNNPKPEDCRQLYLGDCWLQATLISILTSMGPKPIMDMFKDEGDIVKVRLYYPKDRNTNDRNKINWTPKYYTIKKQIPCGFLRLPYYNGGADWVHYLQAAVAKSNIKNKYFRFNLTEISPTGSKIRNYSSVHAGDSALAAHMLLGPKLEKSNYVLKKSIDNVDTLYNLINSLLNNNKAFITLSFDSNSFTHTDSKNEKPEHLDRGLFGGHTYAVVGCKTYNNGTQYIRLINPHDDRMGRKYENYGNDGKKGPNGKKYSAKFREQGDESFEVKASTIFKHFECLMIGYIQK